MLNFCGSESFLRRKRLFFKMFWILYFLREFHMVFKFLAEMAYRTGYWPGSGVSEGTDSVSLNILCNIHEQVNVVHAAVTTFDAMENFFHPTSPLAAGA